MTTMGFTGERFVLGDTSSSLELEHIKRYFFACSYIKNKNVLDIACGSGYGSKILSENGAKSVTGVDLDGESILNAKKKYASENITFVNSDLLKYSSDEKYDVIISFETIEHIDKYEEALLKFKSLLSENGLLIISSPNRLITSPKAKKLNEKPKNIFHAQEFTVDELKFFIEEAGFLVHEKIFGQKIQKYFKSRLLKNIYREVFKPTKNFSPEVTNVPKNRVPKFFILIAENAY